MPRRSSATWGLVAAGVAALLVCALVGYRRAAWAPATPPRRALETPRPIRASAPAPSLQPPVAEAPSAGPAAPTPAAPTPPRPRSTPAMASRQDMRARHTADPCAPVAGRDVPDGYATETADGVTIAWSPAPAADPRPWDAPLRPRLIALVVAGLLDEAAELTGTARRAELTVIVYPSRDEMQQRTHGPAWADGTYDGSVELPARPSQQELGVSMSTLRHEVMHAQLHVGVGCMPRWFNEGVAMYFAGDPPVQEWLELLRDPQPFSLAALQDPAMDELGETAARRAYAQSLAMVMVVAQSGGGLRAAARLLHGAAPHDALELWERMFPGVTSRAVVDALARKLFGTTPGDDLQEILKGGICCYGLASAPDVGCRAAPEPAPAGKTSWSDRSTWPEATCRVHW
jgi:hypothetical protein